MRQVLLFALLLVPVFAFGQARKWRLSLQLQPEMTVYKDRYSWVGEAGDKTTFNAGIASTVQYNINKRIFLSSGIGFISRTLHTAGYLSQGTLPPPKQSFSGELVTTKSVSYRLLSFPVNLGYCFLSTARFNTFITSGLSGNYLLNTYYKSNFSRYDGAYKKNYWQGYTLTAGLGTDYKLTKKFQLTATLLYAFVNKVRPDEYIENRDEMGMALTHNYLSLNIGFKVLL